jgi:hypothetical protein
MTSFCARPLNFSAGNEYFGKLSGVVLARNGSIAATAGPSAILGLNPDLQAGKAWVWQAVTSEG